MVSRVFKNKRLSSQLSGVPINTLTTWLSTLRKPNLFDFMTITAKLKITPTPAEIIEFFDLLSLWHTHKEYTQTLYYIELSGLDAEDKAWLKDHIRGGFVPKRAKQANSL
jgi:hypothetical protein